MRESKDQLPDGFVSSSATRLVLPSRVAQDVKAQAAAATQIWEAIQVGLAPDGDSLVVGSTEQSVLKYRSGDSVFGKRTPEPAPTPTQAVRGQTIIYAIDTVTDFRSMLQTKTGDRDRTKQRTAVADQMLKLGPSRPHAKPVRGWSEQLNRLAETYPNFVEVVEYLKGEYVLRKAAHQPLAFSPFAIHGPAGVGKSMFLESLREVVRCEFRRVQAETAQHASAIVGTAKHWANAEAGVVWDCLVFGKFANPMIYVDEIDKVGQSEGAHAVTSALYSLLEQQSAKNFCDTSMPEIPINASHVQWVFAGNEISNVPWPIRSRWAEFKIPPLKPSEAKRVVQQIYSKLVKEFSVKGLEPLSAGDLDSLSTRSPREVRSVLRQAIARALLNKEKHVKVIQSSTRAEQSDIVVGSDDPGQWIVVAEDVFRQLVDRSRTLH
jgi:ATP-dependent Lon protease